MGTQVSQSVSQLLTHSEKDTVIIGLDVFLQSSNNCYCLSLGAVLLNMWFEVNPGRTLFLSNHRFDLKREPVLWSQPLQSVVIWEMPLLLPL